MTRLAHLLARYGKPIEYDLFQHGFDLACLVKARRVRFLLNIIDQLPATSRYAEAVADDEEAVEALLAFAGGAGGDDQPSPTRRLSEWTPEVAQLVKLTERVNTLVQYTAAVHRQRVPKFGAEPRPEVASERVRRRLRKQRHQALAARVLPPPAQPT